MTVNPDHASKAATIQRVLQALDGNSTDIPSHQPAVNDAGAVYDILQTRNVDAEWITSSSSSPMVVAGNGPILLLSYLDDAGYSDWIGGSVPGSTAIASESRLNGHRKYGAAAALVSLLDSDLSPDLITLIIETDRYRGSLTLESWLKQSPRQFRSALWEASDLPVQPPAVVHSAGGALSVRVTVTSDYDEVEATFSGVLQDVAAMTTGALADLTSSTHEVKLEGFYDGVATPDEESLKSVEDMAPYIDQWLECRAPRKRGLPANHVAMGFFFAPSLSIRTLRITDRHPRFSNQAEVVVEFNLVPGQSIELILKGLARFFSERIEHATIKVTPLLVRPPVTGRSNLAVLRAKYSKVLPVAPGYNPAGLVEAHGIPTIGYVATGHRPNLLQEPDSFEEIRAGSELIQSLISRMHRATRQAEE